MNIGIGIMDKNFAPITDGGGINKALTVLTLENAKRIFREVSSDWIQFLICVDESKGTARRCFNYMEAERFYTEEVKGAGTNYYQVIEQTEQEEIDMYMKLPKEELIMMLRNCQRIIKQLTSHE